MKSFTDRAVVLKSSPYKDSDKIYTFFFKQYGKFSAFGKGVRSIKSKRNGNLDTLNLVDVTLRKGSGDLFFINEAVAVNSYTNLKDDLERSTLGFYFAELVLRLFEEGIPNRQVYTLMKKALGYLDERVYDLGLIEIYFEVRLLNELGYYLVLDSCIVCDKELSEVFTGKDIRLDFNSGGVICDECLAKTSSGNHSKKSIAGIGSGVRLSKKDIFLLSSLSKDKFPKDEANFSVSFDAKDILRLHFAQVSDFSPRTFTYFSGEKSTRNAKNY